MFLTRFLDNKILSEIDDDMGLDELICQIKMRCLLGKPIEEELKHLRNILVDSSKDITDVVTAFEITNRHTKETITYKLDKVIEHPT